MAGYRYSGWEMKSGWATYCRDCGTPIAEGELFVYFPRKRRGLQTYCLQCATRYKLKPKVPRHIKQRLAKTKYISAASREYEQLALDRALDDAISRDE